LAYGVLHESLNSLQEVELWLKKEEVRVATLLPYKTILTSRLLKKLRPNIITRGERSIPETTTKGSFSLTHEKRGSVSLCKNCTIGLCGLGCTKLISAAIMTIQI
jgi:hypothetical protein